MDEQNEVSAVVSAPHADNGVLTTDADDDPLDPPKKEEDEENDSTGGSADEDSTEGEEEFEDCNCEASAQHGENCCGGSPNEHFFVANRNRKEHMELPSTVSVLEDSAVNLQEAEPGDRESEEDLLKADGGKLYLVGTAHFSHESQEDVRKTIAETQPDIVMVELCSSRVNILSMDEETLLKEAKNLTTENIWRTIKQSGFIQGIMHVLLLSMSAHITKQLGMAPGGEFRAAFEEAQKVPGCKFNLGDRPIQITLQRALTSLNFWQKLRLFWYIVISHKTSISKEEVERCKQSDLLEELLREMAGEFPALSRIFVTERDQYMAHSLRTLLRRASYMKRQQCSASDVVEPVVVVGVVGIGHKPGIEANWQKDVDMRALLQVPVKSKGNVILRYGIAGAFFGAATYVMYRGIRWAIGC